MQRYEEIHDSEIHIPDCPMPPFRTGIFLWIKAVIRELFKSNFYPTDFSFNNSVFIILN